MKNATDKEIKEARELLLDLLETDYPKLQITITEINARASEAAELMHRTDLTTSQVITKIFETLIKN